jgi:glycosyltransferase involved in cell wall biosynthesis
VQAGRYGETVPAEDPDALAEALARLLADPTNAFTMGQAARRNAEQQFSPRRHLQRLEEAYRSAATGDPGT